MNKLRAHWTQGMLATVCLRMISFTIQKNINFTVHRSVILSVVFNGCVTQCLTQREKQRLGTSENRMPRKIFGSKREEVTWGWKKLYMEHHDIYFSSNMVLIKSRRLRRAGYVTGIWENRNAYRVSVEKPEGRYSFKYNQQDAMLHNILYCCQCSTCFRQFACCYR
jgi:hypothetical protein